MTPPLPRRPRWRSLALLALCLAPLLWPLEHLAERYYRSELAGQNRQTLDLYVATLFGTLQRYEVLFEAGLVPESPLGRLFRDEAGRVNQAVAALCGRVSFVAAGLPLQLKG